MENVILVHGDNRLFDVIKEINDRNQYRIILFDNGIGDKLKKENISYIDFESFFNEEIKEIATKKIASFYNKIDSNNLWDTFQKTTDSNPINFNGDLKTFALKCFTISCILKKISKTYKINSLIILDDWAGYLQMYVREAKSLDIPVFHVAHGAFHYNSEIGRIMISDKLAVSGRTVYDTELLMGTTPKNKMVATGLPVWDKYAKFEISESEVLNKRKDYNIPDTAKVITFFSSWGPEYFVRNIKESYETLVKVIEDLQRENEIYFIVKLHPFGDEYSVFYESVSSNYNVKNIIFTKDTLEDILLISDFCLSGIETSALLEAIMLGKPSIQIVNNPVPKIFEGDAILYVKNDYEQLNKVLKDFINCGVLWNNTLQKVDWTISRFCFANDGKAAIRIVDEVEKLITKKQKNVENDFNKIKLFIVGITKEMGGGVHAIGNSMARGLDKDKFDVYFFEPTMEKATGEQIEITNSDGINFIKLYNWPLVFIDPNLHVGYEKGNQIINILLDKINPDIVHVHHTISLGFEILKVIDSKGIPVVVTVHDFWFFCPQIQLLRSNLQICDGPEKGSLCYDCMKEWGNYKNESIDKESWKLRYNKAIEILNNHVKLILAESNDVKRFLVENSIKPDLIKVQNPSQLSVDKLYSKTDFFEKPLKKEKLQLTFIGALYPAKGAHVAIQALSELDVNKQNKVTLNIYGNLPEGDYTKLLKDVAAKLPTEINFHGKYNSEMDLDKILKSSDLVIIPSIWRETFGIVVEEALAARVPVVCSNIGGLTEHFTNNIQGILFKPGNFKQLGAIIGNLIENPSIITEWQSNIKQPRLSVDYIKEFEGFYKEILNKSVLVEDKKDSTYNSNKTILKNSIDHEYETIIKSLSIINDSFPQYIFELKCECCYKDYKKEITGSFLYFEIFSCPHCSAKQKLDTENITTFIKEKYNYFFEEIEKCKLPIGEVIKELNSEDDKLPDFIKYLGHDTIYLINKILVTETLKRNN